MALRYAVATGNWSNPAIWNGGTLPGVGDQVHANTFTVTIDQDIDVDRITNAVGAPAVEGGSFTVSSIPGGGRTLACSVYAASAACLTISASGTVTGLRTCVGGRLTNSHGVLISGGFTVALTGDTFMGGTATNNALGLAVNTGAVLTVTANKIVGSVGTSAGFASIGSGTPVTLTANTILGGGGSYGCRLGFGPHVVTIGEAIAQIGLALEYIFNQNAATSITVGRCVASMTNNAIWTSATANLRVSGPLVYAPNGRAPLFAPYFMVTPDFAGIQMADDSGDGAWGEPMILTTGVVDPPLPADVRVGTTFGVAGELTGTMAVPPAEAVSQGTPTGVVTGTASLPLEPLADVLEQQLISAGG